MKIEAVFNTTGRLDDGLADIRLRGEGISEHQLDLPIADLYRRCGVPSSVALDLLITASLCYVTDKIVSRAYAFDGWTRSLDLRLPVSAPKRWNAMAKPLSQTLTFLTGDVWSLHFYLAPQPFLQAPAQQPLPNILPVDAVALFSGGLDSLAGAIDLLAGGEAKRVLLVGHYDSPGPRHVQAELAERLKERYPGRVEALHIRVAHRPTKAAEQTLRSRSFMFMALGLYAAQGFGKLPLHMFENGLIALNIPLTPSRSGSCSTRTMHPYFLEQMSVVTAGLGIENAILNPYAFKTKGECITDCAGLDLLSALASRSVSCSHGSRRQNWVRKTTKNCGYCVPCLFRRAAMHRAGLDQGDEYGIDVLQGEMSATDASDSAADLRALSAFLKYPATPRQLQRKLLASARLADVDAYVKLAQHGFTEVRDWLKGGLATPHPKGAAGHA